MLLVLFPDGDSIARSNDVETAYRRVNDYQIDYATNALKRIDAKSHKPRLRCRVLMKSFIGS